MIPNKDYPYGFSYGGDAWHVTIRANDQDIVNTVFVDSIRDIIDWSTQDAYILFANSLLENCGAQEVEIVVEVDNDVYYARKEMPTIPKPHVIVATPSLRK